MLHMQISHAKLWVVTPSLLPQRKSVKSLIMMELEFFLIYSKSQNINYLTLFL